jgi:hypothetical protein
MDEKTKKDMMLVVNPYTKSTFEIQIKKDHDSIEKALKMIDRAYRIAHERKP